MKNRFGFTFKTPISIALSFSLLAQPFLAQLAQAQSTQSIFYDTNGNMTKDENGNTYEYDAENRLISFVKGGGSLKTEYTYYADGLRKSKQITLKDKSASDPIVFYYDHAKNANVVNEVQGSGSAAITSSYLMVADTRYARYLSNDASGAKYYVKNHKDTTMTVGANGASPISHSYTPYGLERDSKGTNAPKTDFSIASNPFLYSSQYTDAESGLQYLRARYYKADHMRFISRDTNSVPRNKYAYANGNPIMEDDPSGMMADKLAYAFNAIGLALSILSIPFSAGSSLAFAAGVFGAVSAGTGLYAQSKSGKEGDFLNTLSLVTGIASTVIGIGGIAAGRLAARATARAAAEAETATAARAARAEKAAATKFHNAETQVHIYGPVPATDDVAARTQQLKAQFRIRGERTPGGVTRKDGPIQTFEVKEDIVPAGDEYFHFHETPSTPPSETSELIKMLQSHRPPTANPPASAATTRFTGYY